MSSSHYEIKFTPSFLRSFKKSHPHLQDEIETTIEKLKDASNHQSLRVHKLSGRLKNFYSCSVNYQQRIVFEFREKTIIVLLAVGDHDVYR
ncbi:MAG: type II toxin-antitoxin system mRNA interferase toxin, RelE/StbE family [Candidatus Pacebacteria bacterium]|nr:type II toxin-antitoxin system mRNA interferase toxin, RelE/StbE family [Candidatus Paceibacterota bacterium]